MAMPAGAAGKAGALDHGFNGDGKVATVFPSDGDAPSYPEYRVPYEFLPGRIAMASAPGGKLVDANSKAIVEYLADGRRNPRFGGNGAVPIASLEGSSFQLADIAVDSHGRVVVAGTTRPKAGYGMGNLSLPGPIPSVATIERYLPNGQPDPTFGAEGVVNTNLGASPPTFQGQAYSGSAIAVVGLAIDQADRPILTGSAVVEVGHCAPSSRQGKYERSQAIVARLTTDGAPDSTFAENGTKSIGGLSWLGFPAATPARTLSLGSNTEPCPKEGPGKPSVLAGIGTDGSIDQGFGSGGFWSRPFTRVADLAVAPSGEVFLVTKTIELSHGRWVASAPTIVGLRADGSFDPDFGHGGRADPRLPSHAGIAAIASDTKGRVLLAGTVSGKARHSKRRHLKFLLIRMTASGERDPDFGHRGQVTTSFGPRVNVRAADIVVDSSGRIAVGGKLSSPKRSGAFAVARYLGR
jgi:uncharacterized delta-60 repeat protein